MMSGLTEIDIVERLVKLEQVTEDIPEIKKTLNELNLKFARYEGTWGVITLIGAAVWGAFVVFKDDIINFFHGK